MGGHQHFLLDCQTGGGVLNLSHSLHDTTGVGLVAGVALSAAQVACDEMEKSRGLCVDAFPKSRCSGFTLIELMIGIVIMIILAAAALPSLQAMLKNSQIRNAAESVSNGLQRARAEAVARNTNVAFVLGVQSSWTVSVVTPASGIESRSANEGSKDVTVTVLPAGATTATFNNFGAVVANAGGSASLTQIDFAVAGSNRDLRVTLGAGGTIKMCDPTLASGTSPSAC